MKDRVDLPVQPYSFPNCMARTDPYLTLLQHAAQVEMAHRMAFLSFSSVAE